jgi:4-alpha-glucanotransferase
LAKLAGLDDQAPLEQWIAAAHRLLSRASALIYSATLEDVMAVGERPNLPNTTQEQWPNWSIGLPGGLEALKRAPLASTIAETFSAAVRRRRENDAGTDLHER